LGYLSVWKVLDEIIADFRKKNVTPSSEIMSDLKSARTLLNIWKADQSRSDALQKIDEYLVNVESYLVTEGQKAFGASYVDQWLKKIDEASRKVSDEEDEEETRFVHGVPRDQKWIRVTPTSELPAGKLAVLAKESNLSYIVQKDGVLLVYGEDERVKGFIKKMQKSEARKRGGK
jgi:hypothetical protein